MFLDQHPPKDCPTEPAESVMDALKKTLHGGSELRVSVVRDEAAAGGPDSGVGDPWRYSEVISVLSWG